MHWPRLPRRRGSVGLLGVSFPWGGCGGGHVESAPASHDH